ncbi:MAG: sigma-70 family RNA polymerase sigma factor [Oscillospiraceae bacterium]|nr:sigma-70 family RNA polymerase sigma factor [Oscillospiraceae bacterium]
MMERDLFIEQNLPLVHSLANRFRGKGIEYEELYSAGCVGLVKACDNFDHDRGLCFSTYAVPVILGEIRRLFRDGGSVKVSRSLKELSLRAARERDRILSEGREPRISEIAERLGVSQEAAAEAINAGIPPLSLSPSEDDETATDIPVSSGEERLIDRLALKSCLAELSDNDRRLILLRYGRELTQTQTAAILGMTQVQVSRRERKILAAMREKMV